MFGFRKKEVVIYSPAKGKIVNLENVPDEMFSKKMLGDGAAIEIDDDIIHAPQDGVIRALFPTKHAFVLETKERIQILVHIGLDTVSLEGKGFEAIVDIDSKVKAGDPIIKVDRSLIKSKGFNLITMVIITNIEKVKDIDVFLDRDGDIGVEMIACKI
ncbi:PTS glucose transporter subunit IIA [Clostridium sp. YIM B02506]|uniref:PTS sugar transporter subunit IIA n=1 Tax=Clostridium sp. YIM B02506 TaxID=2910680 RepID=UPI001EED4702|nr:PTS glucose transporter subunit IIA [Clostridium sp. YIM B02506]